MLQYRHAHPIFWQSKAPKWLVLHNNELLSNLRLVTWQPARHHSALPIAIRNIKHHKTHNTTPKLNVLITNKGRNTYFNVFPSIFSSKALIRKRQHIISISFYIFFSHKTTFTFITWVLTPWQDASSQPPALAPSGGWQRHLHHLRRGGGTSTTSGDECISSSLQKQKDHQLTHN